MEPTYARESVLNFHSVVRQTDSKMVLLKNPTNHKWTVRSIISGQDLRWWSVKSDVFVVEAQQSKSVEIIYAPKTMTNSNMRHEGMEL